MGPIDRLILDGRIPPAVEEKHILRELEVQAHGARAVGEQQHGVFFLLLELLDAIIAGGGRHATVVFEGSETGEFAAEPAERFHPLAEDERLLPTGVDLLEIGLQALELRTLPGEGVEIADLLEPEHQFEDVLNCRLLAQVRKPQHPFLLRPAIGLPLLGCQFDSLVAVEPGRHVFEHLVLGATEHMVGRGGPHRPRRHPLVEMARGDELKHPHEIVGAIFDRCARERPATAAGYRSHRLARLAGAVLDPLCLVEHHQVERQPKFRDQFTVANEGLVVGNFHRHIGERPLPPPPLLVSFDHGDQKLRRPVGQLPSPIADEPLRADHEHAAGLTQPHEQSDRRDRLHRLAKAHLIGQHRAVPRHQKRHPVKLEGKRLAGKLEAARLEDRLEIGLQQIEKPLRELDDIGRRGDPRPLRRRRGACFRASLQILGRRHTRHRRGCCGCTLRHRRWRGDRRLKPEALHNGLRIKETDPSHSGPRHVDRKPQCRRPDNPQIHAGHNRHRRDRQFRRPP